jgi:thiamine biosynthesis lipoprotein
MIRDTRILMGMPVTVEIVDDMSVDLLNDVYAYFASVDARFSLFKPESEISAFNQGRLVLEDLSPHMHEILALSERTKRETNGYFEIRRPDGALDPSGIVKGWAIRNAAHLLRLFGAENFFVDAGGDVQTWGKNVDGQDWKIGIRSPFNEQEIVKVLTPKGRGVATSGSYVRGQHIYNPHEPGRQIEDIVSLTVIGPDVLEADRFATAAFAMGRAGIHFIQKHPDLEGYVIDFNGIATQTTGLRAYVAP